MRCMTHMILYARRDITGNKQNWNANVNVECAERKVESLPLQHEKKTMGTVRLRTPQMKNVQTPRLSLKSVKRYLKTFNS